MRLKWLAAEDIHWTWPRLHGRALPHLLALLLLLAAHALRAQGGPPFLTDDPDTPGKQHWEINFGWIGDRNPAAGSYQVPDLDINYGLGARIQLKFEIPIAVQETRPQPASGTDPATPGHVIGGIGGSIPGIKLRFYEHHPGEPWMGHAFGTGLLTAFTRRDPSERNQQQPGPEAHKTELPVDFSVSTYPQLYLDSSARSVARGLVDAGPNFLLPLEFSTRIGPIRINGDFGYSFGNQTVPQSWIRGLLVGHEFNDRTEAYLEIYDQQDANRVYASNGTRAPKKRQATLGLGGRRSLNKNKTLNLLLMGGRSFQAVSVNNSQPSWIAYTGFQVLFGGN